jgi:hypothetical protein
VSVIQYLVSFIFFLLSAVAVALLLCMASASDHGAENQGFANRDRASAAQLRLRVMQVKHGRPVNDALFCCV